MRAGQRGKISDFNRDESRACLVHTYIHTYIRNGRPAVLAAVRLNPLPGLPYGDIRWTVMGFTIRCWCSAKIVPNSYPTSTRKL
jgi:hypothetical protein